eukprot:5019823-Heterocapsa_arctica.AAC.1
MVFVKAAGGQHTEKPKRKWNQLDPEQAGKGRGKSQEWGYKGADQAHKSPYGSGSGWQDNSWGRSPSRN